MVCLLRLLLVVWFWVTGMSFWLDNSCLAVSSLNSLNVFNSALQSLNQGDYQRAWQDLTTVINIQDDLSDSAYHARCVANLQLAQYDAAEADCLKAIEFNPDNGEARLNLGLAYLQQQKYQQALAENQQIIRQNRRDYRAYYNQGLVYFALENYPQALQSYNLALKVSDSIPQEQQVMILNERSLTYKRLKYYGKAIADLKQAIMFNPQDESLYFNLGCTAHEARKINLAINNFNQAIALNPNFTQAYLNLAVIYDQMGEKKLALHHTRIMLQKCQQTNDKIGEQKAIALERMILKTQPSYLV